MSKEIKTLEAELKKHNHAYWVTHKPVISDFEYDKLVERLRELDPKNPALEEFVEDAADAKSKVKHDVAMLSLEKKFLPDEIVKWATAAKAFCGKEAGVVCSYKIDGSSCTLMYENGELVYAATRGNGKAGDDVTANVRTIKGVPQKIASKKKIEIRGEVYMSNAAFNDALALFEDQKAKGEIPADEEPPSNPRNYCAGSLKQKDPEITRQRKLSFMAHNVVLHTDSPQTTEIGLLTAVKKLGFETPVVKLITDPDEIPVMIAKIEKERAGLPYGTDGVVFGINGLSLHAEMGNTAHHPRFRIAFKFARERGETLVTNIHWNTSRTGRVVPQIEMKPISLGGAVVTFATGHNAKNIKDLDLAAGDKILMEREVIPYLVEKTDGKGGANMPKKCNSCQTALVWDESDVDLVCPNMAGCPEQLASYLRHYVARKVVNIMGVGDTLIQKLIDAKLVKTPADFFRLTEDQLKSGVARQGESSAEKIVKAIQEKREQDLGTFLYSLGIPSLGNTISEKLAERFGTLKAVLEASEEELKMDKIGDKLASSIYEGLRSRKDLIIDLTKEIKIKTVEKIEGSLTGKSFCLTGKVEFDFEGKHYDSRPDIEDLLKTKGAAIKSGVSKDLTYLVAGDDAGSKLEKAQKAGVKILDGAALVKMLG